MKVVLDSNIIIADFWIRSVGFKILFEKAKKGEIELYIPQVVFDEVTNKFCQQVIQMKDDIEKMVSKLEKLSGSTFGLSVSDSIMKKSKAKYKAHLKKIISANDIKVIDYPKTKHEYLARKAMLSRKPFNSNEKGYRDNLIWENIKSNISPAGQGLAVMPEIIFITNNYKDFAGEDNNLHEDLKSELEEEDLNSESAAVYSSLSEFNEKVTKLLFAQARLFEEKLTKGEFDDFDLKSKVDKFLFDKFVGSDLDKYYEFAPFSNDRPTVSAFDDDYGFDKISARKLNSKEFIVDVAFKLDVEIDYYIDKSEYRSRDNLKVHVIDSDWNEHVVAVSNIVTLAIQMTLVINSNFQCNSIEIDKINDEYIDGPGDEYG